MSSLHAESGLAREYQRIEAGLARLPPSAMRWSGSVYRPDTRARLVNQWRQRQQVEYRSSMVFTQLASQLYEAAAPEESVAVMLRMAQDEVRHARRCEAVRHQMGDVEPVTLESVLVPLARHEGLGARERALRNVI